MYSDPVNLAVIVRVLDLVNATAQVMLSFGLRLKSQTELSAKIKV